MAAARTITPVNIRLGVDVTKIKEGMQVTSTELRNLSRLTAQSAEGMTKLGYATDLFNKFVAAGQVSRAEADRILESLAKKYGVVTDAAKEAAEAEKAVADEQRRLNDLRAQSSNILKSLQSDEEKYLHAIDLLQQSLKEKIITDQQYIQGMERLRLANNDLSASERAALTLAEQKANAEKELIRLRNSLATSNDKYAASQQMLNESRRLELIGDKELSELLVKLAKSHGILTEEEKKDKAEQDRLNESRRQAQSIIKSMETDSQKFANAEKAVIESHQRGELVGVNLGEALRKLRVQYDQLTPAERAESESLKLASDRMKEYERIIATTVTRNDEFDTKLAGLNTQLHRLEITTAQYKAAVAALRNEYGIITGSQQRFQALQERGRIAGEEMIDAQTRLKAVLDRGQSITMKYSAVMNQFAADMRAGRISALEFAAAMRQLNSEMDDEEKAQKKGKTGFFGTLISPRALATGAAFAGIGAAISGAKGIMSLTMAQEEVTALTKALTQSEVATKELLASYRQLDRESMLSFAAFGEAGKQMLAVGMSVKEITPMLQGLSKVSGGNEERFHSLVRAMTQVQTAGRLTASEMLQFTNAGWSPLNQIAKRAGETMAETKKRIEAGAVSVNEVKMALMDATIAGGAFANVNEEMQQTFTGAWAKFKSDIQAASMEIGTGLVPAMKEMLSVVKSTSETLQYVLAPFTGYIKFASLLIAVQKDLVAPLRGEKIGAVSNLLDQYDEINKDLKFAEEVAKRKTQNQQEFLEELKIESSEEKKLRETKEQVAAYNKEILKLEEQTSEAIEKKWYKAKFGEEGEIQRLKDKIAFQNSIEKLKPQEQMRLNEQRIAEIELIDRNKERAEKQQKMIDSMRQELAATEELIRLRKGGLVVSEEDLKKHEKMKEFGNSQARAEYERMYNRKIALDTEEKRLKEIQAEAKKNQEKFQRPEVSFQENVAKLMQQRQFAGLTPDAFEGAGMDLARSFLQAMNPQNVSASTAPTMRAGSVEAYKFIAQQNEKSKQAAEAKKLWEEQRDLLKDIATQNKNAPRLAMAGRN